MKATLCGLFLLYQFRVYSDRVVFHLTISYIFYDIDLPQILDTE